MGSSNKFHGKRSGGRHVNVIRSFLWDAVKERRYDHRHSSGFSAPPYFASPTKRRARMGKLYADLVGRPVLREISARE